MFRVPAIIKKIIRSLMTRSYLGYFVGVWTFMVFAKVKAKPALSVV